MVSKVEVRDVPDRVAKELLIMARRQKKSRNQYLKEILIDLVAKEDERKRKEKEQK